MSRARTGGCGTLYQLPNGNSAPVNIVAGPDGRLWFTEGNADAIGAITTSGRITQYPVPGNGVAPWGRTAGCGSPSNPRTTLARLPRPACSRSTHCPTPMARTTVTITGANLGGATAVSFGSARATGVVAVDAAHVLATVPAGGGTVGVTVTTPEGTPAPGVFRYGSALPAPPAVTGVSPAVGLISGGNKVTIRGANLAGGKVRFGARAARASCTADSCAATALPGAVGTVNIVVSDAGGVSAATPADEFTYLAPAPPAPVVTSVTPASGPVAGGNTITVRGAHLSGGIVIFGLNQAIASCTATACKVTVPPGGLGTVSIQVITAGGVSAVTRHDRYTYLA